MMSGRVHDILASVLFHATYPQNLSNSKEPQGLLIHSTPLAGFKIWMFVQQLKTRQK